MNNKVKWGILGTANIASWGTIPGMKQSASCELYAIAGRNLDKAEDYKKRFGFKKVYGVYDQLLNDPDVQAAVKKVADELGDSGRILVRESGTEPLIRVMVEAETDELCEKYVDSVIDVIKAKGHIE